MAVATLPSCWTAPNCSDEEETLWMLWWRTPTCLSRLLRTSLVSAWWHSLGRAESGGTDNCAVLSPQRTEIFVSGEKMGSCYLFRHWTEVLSCLISSSAFLSAMSLCLCWSSSRSCNVIRSVLNASDKEENLFSMSWSDKFSALKIFSILFSRITGIVLQD